VLVVAFIVTPVLADDINLPPWTRGDERTTFQQWEFDLPNPTPPAPKISQNPYGDAALAVVPTGPWIPDYYGRFGIWPLSGEIRVDIPNAPDHPDWDKHVWIQLTWAPGQGGGFGPFPTVEVHGITGQEMDTIPIGPGDWVHSTWLVELDYNPPLETVLIFGDILVDELVIDTICIPEPATMSLLALGGLAVLRRRRKR